MFQRTIIKRWQVMMVVFLLFGTSVFGQSNNNEKVLAEEYVGKPLKALFKFMDKEYDFQFAYDANLIRKKTCLEQYQYTSAEDLLVKIISPYALSFRKAGKVYIILPSKDVVKEIEPVEITRTDFDITGQVIDKKTGEALPYAFLRIQNTNIWTETNLDGRFSLKNLPNDTLVLAVNYLGYNLYSQRLNKLSSENNVIRLEVLGSYLSQVDIINNKIEAIKLDEWQGYHQIDPSKIDLITVNGQPDLFKALQLLSGVQTEDASSSALVIRNSNESENLVMLDGLPIYHLSHFFGIYSTVNPDFVKSVRLYKSAYGAEFSDRIGGVVDITGKSGDLKKTRLKLDMNLISGGFFLETPIIKEKTSMAIAMRQSHANQLESNLYRNLLNINLNEGINRDFPSVENLNENVNLSFYDFNVNIHHHFADDFNMSVHLFSAGDEYDNELIRRRAGAVPLQRFEKKSLDNSIAGSLGFGINMSKQWRDDFHSHLSWNRSEFQSRYFFNDLDTEFQNDFVIDSRLKSGSQQNKLIDSGIRLDNTLAVKDNQKVKFGLDFHQYNQNNWRLAESVGLEVNNQFRQEKSDKNLFSIYVVDEMRLKNDWQITGGIRASKYEGNKKVQAYPRVELRKKLNEKWVAKFAGGIYGQYIRKVTDERISQNQPDEWILSNNDIAMAKSKNVVAAINYRNEDWVVKLAGYYKSNSGTLINSAQDSLQSLDELTTGNLLEGNSEILGGDLTILKSYKNHSAWLAYSLSGAYSVFDEINEGSAFPAPDNGVKYNMRFKDNVLSLGAGVFNLFDRDNFSQRTYEAFLQGSDLDTELIVNIVDLELLGISPNFSVSYTIK